MTVRGIDIHHGDCRDVLKTIPDDSVDACVTDPPYALVSIVKRFGAASATDATQTSERVRTRADGYARAAAGFMGQTWDTGETAFDPAFWREVLRVLKPGAHLIAFGGTRTYHRLACAIEDAGFEIRDQIGWLYGSGFPKSHNVAVAIDKHNGIEPRSKAFNMKGRGDRAEEMDANGREFLPPYEAATDAAKQWQGWGTALKPAQEPVCLARKPLVGTVAKNVLRFGTGALNIDGCRVPTDETIKATRNIALGSSGAGVYGSANVPGVYEQKDGGRWPANVIHDGSEEVLAAFAAYGRKSSGVLSPHHDAKPSANSSMSGGNYAGRVRSIFGGDTGSAARFFYSSKADADDRWGSRHPTVKPVDLICYLCRLITPPGGLVLDPFAGSGTTAVACLAEGFRNISIEREAEYVKDIRERVAFYSGEGRHSLVSKNRNRTKRDTAPGPLFDGAEP